MGAWGEESSACDDVWDLLGTAPNADIFNLTQDQANLAVTAALADDTCSAPRQSSNLVGVITHILNQGLQVGDDYLKIGISRCNELLESDWQDWEDPEERFDALNVELKMMQTALAKQPVPRRVVRGLIEKIEDVNQKGE